MAKLKVNRKDYAVDVSPDTPLLWVLRETLGLTGTKFGCGVAQCGACTVHINGQAVRSCVTPVGAVRGREVVTTICEIHRTWNRPEAAELAKLYTIVAPNYGAVIESYQKAQEVIKQQKR